MIAVVWVPYHTELAYSRVGLTRDRYALDFVCEEQLHKFRLIKFKDLVALIVTLSMWPGENDIVLSSIIPKYGC